MTEEIQTGKHTLEKLAEALGDKWDEEKVHAAMLLAFADSLYSVVRRDGCVPSPLYRIKYNEQTNNVSLETMMGMSLPDEEWALDLGVIDEIFCCHIRDIPLLLEGETGIGKTYAAMKYLSTVFDKERYFSHRLSANAFLNNLFSHFQEGRMNNGMPEIEAKQSAIDNCAAGCVDEINRGDSNETLQLFDNEMHCAGKIYKLGLPIPKVDVDTKNKTARLSYKPGKRKKLLIVCAQNPAGADDAKFTQTLQLDAAVDNRLLKTDVGNASSSAGSTLWLTDRVEDRHKCFLENFIEQLEKKYLREELKGRESVFKDIQKDWLSMCAWLSEAERTDKPILYSANELADLMIAVFGGNLIDYYNYERKVIGMLDKKLGKGITVRDPLQETENVKKIHKVIESFKVPVIFRDIVQMKKLADVLATKKNIEDALQSKDPVKTYLQIKKYVTVREVVRAITLLSKNKQAKNSVAPENEINQVLAQYVDLLQDYMRETEYGPSNTFNLFDHNAGIKKIAVEKSIRDLCRAKDKTVEVLVGNIAECAKTLLRKISVSEDIKNVLIARSVGDLMTLCSFLTDYREEINEMLKKYDSRTSIGRVIDDLSRFYYRKLADTAVVFPDIYQHRVQRTLGI
jgi:hypothetical protein